MCGELIEKKLDDIVIGPYVRLFFPEKPLCEPTPDEINRAIREWDFDKRGYQEHAQELVKESNGNGVTPEEYNPHAQQYHTQRIAYLIRFGFEHDAVRLDATDCRVFVFFAVNGFEILSNYNRRRHHG